MGEKGKGIGKEVKRRMGSTRVLKERKYGQTY